MIPLFRNKPVRDSARIRAMMLAGLRFMALGSLICYVCLSLILGLQDIQTMAAYAVGSLIYWGVSLVFIVPAIMLLWRPLQWLLQNGLHGIGIAIGIGGAIGAAIGLIISRVLQSPDPLMPSVIFVGAGMGYGLLFWIGLVRAK